jgi:membrane-associated phospholipid phosphatase
MALALASCADATGSSPAAGRPAEASARERGLTAASIEWNQVARDLVARNRSSTFVAFRVYATVSDAQIRAVVAAEGASRPGRYVSRRAAVAAASAAALTYLHPGDSAYVDSLLRARIASRDWLEHGRVDAEAGEAVGRAAGAAAVERAKGDGYSAPWTGTIPTGPGMWYSGATPPAPPAGATIGGARTFFLVRGDQFRPSPPPAFGSPEFVAATAEVRAISDGRTVAQDSIAKFWALGAGTHTPPGYWNAELATMMTRERFGERAAAGMLALLNLVAYDAIVASHEAKYHYWLLRPSQADPGITLSMALPNFPSYPSNHATISAAMADVIAAAFPGHAARVRALADEAALSRVYGGIHYRFDGETGLALGRRIAAYAIEKAAREGSPMAIR